MASKKGRTTFADLSRRWAADRHYGASIEWVANNFRQSFCKGPDPVEETEPGTRKPVKRTAAAQPMAPAANLGGPADTERVEAEPGAETKRAPVRTIWSAADGPTTPSTMSDATEAEPGDDVRVCDARDARANAQARRRDGGRRAARH